MYITCIEFCVYKRARYGSVTRHTFERLSFEKKIAARYLCNINRGFLPKADDFFIDRWNKS